MQQYSEMKGLGWIIINEKNDVFESEIPRVFVVEFANRNFINLKYLEITTYQCEYFSNFPRSQRDV